MQLGRKSFLQIFVASLSSVKVIPPAQQSIIDECFESIESGEMDSVTFESIIYQLADKLDEHMIVWKMAATLSINQLFDRGPAFIYLVSLPDIKTCMAEMVRLKDLILEPSYSIRFYKEQQSIVAEVTETVAQSLCSHIKSDVAMCLILYLLRQVSDQDFDFDKLYVPENRPYFDSKPVSAVTKARVTRHQGSMVAKFPIELLNSKNTYHAKDFSNKLKVQIDELLTSFLIQLPLSEKVHKYLSFVEKPAAQSIKSVASNFGMSQATFRRNLVTEKTSFKQLQKKILENIYLKALLTSNIEIEALALRLGYSGRSTFERAFSTRFGMTPTAYRKLNGLKQT